jgi:hypothetical protein
VPAVDHTIHTLDVLATHLHESHEVSVYDAIERLVLVAEAVGLGADALVRMLDRGMGLEEMIELIESRMECLQQVTELAVENKTAA